MPHSTSKGNMKEVSAINSNTLEGNTHPVPVKPSRNRLVFWARELAAIVFWVSIVVHLLFVDVFQLLLNTNPQWAPVVRYRFFVLIGLISLGWLALGNRRFARTGGFILCYPLILLLLHLPIAFVKHWPLFVVFSPALYSLIRHFRLNFVLASWAAIAALIVCAADPQPSILVSTGIFSLGTYLLIHYGTRLKRGYSQSSVFTELKPEIVKLRAFVEKLGLGKPPSQDSVTLENKAFREQFGQSLLAAYFVTAFLYFISEKMRQIVNSRRLDIYFVTSLAYSAFLTTSIYGFMYFGLYRLNPKSFSGASDATLIDFFGYSFSTLMTASVSPIGPASRDAYWLSQLEVVSALTLLVLLVFLVLTSIRERYRNDLDAMVLELKETSQHASNLMLANSALTMEGIVAMLVELNPGTAKFAITLMHGSVTGTQLYEQAVAARNITRSEEPDALGLAEPPAKESKKAKRKKHHD